MNLPEVIPLFPLPNAVLFPGVVLPLHVFEPRYRDMVCDSARSDPALIGMVLLRGDWREHYHDRPDVFPVGCAGELVRVDHLADGRYNIVLNGVREFHIRREVGSEAYRQAAVSWREPGSDRLSEEQRRGLRAVVTRHLVASGAGAGDRLLGDDTVPDEFFVNLASFATALPPMEKQALLEAVGTAARAARLRDLLEFALHEPGPSGSGSLH
jgi:hypothetical protein